MPTNSQVAAPRWDYGYFEDLLKNPLKALPDLNEARPHISLLFCVLHKKHIPELAKVTKLDFPARPSVPVRNRSVSFEEHEKRCHQMNLDYFTAICNEIDKNQSRFIRSRNNEALALVATEMPRLRALINIVQCIVEPKLAQPIPEIDYPVAPYPSTIEEQYTHLPVAALFSLSPKKEDNEQIDAYESILTSDSPPSIDAQLHDFNHNVQSTNEELHETNASIADDPYTPISFSLSSIDSSSSSSIISSYSLDWKMDLSFDPFAKCDLPRQEEEEREEPTSLFQFEMNTDGRAFKMSSTVVNANSILEMCVCRKKNDEESKRKSEFVMEQLIKEIPRNMTDEISEILLQLSMSSEAAKMH